jgi:hypothetical protein
MTAYSPLSLFHKGDLLLKVNESNLDGLTLSEAVYQLRSTLQSPCVYWTCSPPMSTCSLLSLFQKGDLLLKVNESSLDKLTHS